MAVINGVDSKGKINQAQVDGEGRLSTRSVSENEIEHAVGEGRAFQTYTTELNISSATKVVIFYLKNNDVNDVMITSATIGTSVSTGGSDNIILIEQVGGIQPGDDIVSATDSLVTNRNSGAPRVFVGDVKKGPSTLGGTEVAVNGTLADFTESRTFDLTARIPKGGTIGVTVKAPTSTTSMDITLTVAFHVISDI